MSRVVVYQAVSNGYDRPKPPKGLPHSVDYQLTLGNVAQSQAALWNRFHKIVSVPQWGGSSAYFDGNIAIADPPTIGQFVNAAIQDYDLALYRHPNRKCAYVEIEACLGRGKITSLQAEMVHDNLKKIGLPHDYGLWACGVIIRRSDVDWLTRVQKRWYDYCRLVCRDQLWLTAVLYEMRTEVPARRIRTIDADIFKNETFHYSKHA